jgi:lysophospholipase L1-like esterase
MPADMKSRRLALKLVLALCSCVAGAGVAEVGLRWSGAAKLPLGVPGLAGRAAFVDRPEGFRFAYNSAGYRSAEVPARRPPGEIRIALLGDSHTFGLGVDDDERFGEQIGRGAAAALHHPVAMINMAQPGDAYDRFLERLRDAARWVPDLVVVVTYTGNDFGETAAAQLYGGRKAAGPQGGWTLPALRRLQLWHLMRLRPRVAADPFIGSPECGGAFSTPDVGPFTQSVFQACTLRSPAARRAAIELAGRQVHALLPGAPILMVCLPSKLLVGESDARQRVQPIAARFAMDWTQVLAIERSLHQAAVAIGERECEATTDLLPALTKAAGEPLYFPTDWHLNVRGHRVVAEALLPVVVRMLRDLHSFRPGRT